MRIMRSRFARHTKPNWKCSRRKGECGDQALAVRCAVGAGVPEE
jgi:hypothetical protein